VILSSGTGDERFDIPFTDSRFCKDRCDAMFNDCVDNAIDVGDAGF